MIHDDILSTIGSTPIIKLNRITKNLKCNLYVKCELFNPGGSVKDRIGYNMVIEAEKEGRIKPGDTLIEPTSGNTGIGLALAAAVRGYKMIITMPKKMSQEKEDVLKSLGAQVIRTRTEAAWNDPDSLIGVAKKLNKEIPNSHILDQYANGSNPNAHYKYTAQEIINDFPDGLDMIVCGVGTGGTITGLAKRLKEEYPNIIVVGADPYGSILGGGDEVYPYQVEGIGYDFFPDVLDNNLVDEYVKVNDENSFKTARDLIKFEGLLIGGSCGTATYAAMEAAKKLTENQKCLVMLPDSIRNYLSKFVNDEWMIEHNFQEK
jgi:cysteine synthase A